MNELLEALGLEIQLNQLFIRLVKPSVFITGYATITNKPATLGQVGSIINYNPVYNNEPIIHWVYQTEFGVQLGKYNAQQQQAIYQQQAYSSSQIQQQSQQLQLSTGQYHIPVGVNYYQGMPITIQDIEEEPKEIKYLTIINKVKQVALKIRRSIISDYWWHL